MILSYSSRLIRNTIISGERNFKNVNDLKSNKTYLQKFSNGAKNKTTVKKKREEKCSAKEEDL